MARFLLDLREQNKHPNGSLTPQNNPRTLRFVARRVINTIITDFGDPEEPTGDTSYLSDNSNQ
jgi:hypothetical protein